MGFYGVSTVDCVGNRPTPSTYSPFLQNRDKSVQERNRPVGTNIVMIFLQLLPRYNSYRVMIVSGARGHVLWKVARGVEIV